MEVLEIILLILAYSLGIIALFIEAICYFRKIETIETIFFTASILFFIITLTATYFFYLPGSQGHANVFILLSMILVGLTTLLNVLGERKHGLSPLFRKVLLFFSLGLSVVVLIGYLYHFLDIAQYLVALFLGVSVVYAMFLIRTTKPQMRIEHRDKIERDLALACLIILPITLAINFVPQVEAMNLKIGFTLPTLFILLTGAKIWDDIKRLSLFKPENKIVEQSIQNYSFTKREKEVVSLLIKGATYKQIAETLFISIPTVKTHTTNIYKKTGVNNKIELVALLSN